MSEHDAIEQLAALLDGEDMPDAAPSLGRLADLATAVRDHADLVAPTSEFRSSLRAELLAAADAPPGLVERAQAAWTARTANLRASARVAVATMTASSMIGSAGVAVAAQDALPGEFLHGLKSLTEDARLMLAVDGVAEARLHLAFARERLEELRATAGQLDTDEVVALLAEMDTHSQAGADALLEGVRSGAVDADEVRRFTTDQRGGLVSVFNDLPLLAKPEAEDSLELLRRIEASAVRVTPRANAERGPDRTGMGLLAELKQAAERETPRDLALAPASADGDVETTSPAPNPAVPLEDTELRTEDESAETTSSTDDETPQGGAEQPEDEAEQEPTKREPLEPTGELVAPATEGDESDSDDEDEDEGLLDKQQRDGEAPTAAEELSVDPVEETAEAVEDTTNTAVRTDPVDGDTTLLDD